MWLKRETFNIFTILLVFLTILCEKSIAIELDAKNYCVESATWDIECTSLNLGSVRDLQFNNDTTWPVSNVLFTSSDIQTIPNNTFTVFYNLTTIFFTDCNLKYLYPLNFENADELKKLILGENKLRTLLPRVFETLANLDLLDFEKNVISDLNNDSFFGLGELKYLNLNDNKITRLPAGIFEPLLLLQTLELRGNQIESLDENIFKSNYDLTDVDLRKNRLKMFNSNLIAHILLKNLYLGGNSLTDLQIGSIGNLDVSEGSLKKIHIKGFAEALHAQKNQLLDVTIDDLTQLTELNLANNSLKNFTNLMYNADMLKFLDLSHNPIEAVNETTFANATQLIVLDLTATKIKEIDVGVFQPLKELVELYLDKNITVLLNGRLKLTCSGFENKFKF